jgi:hypothetical protein
MKKTILLSITLFTILSCKVNEKPEFLRVENIEVLESTRNHVTLKADAFFINHNNVSGELETEEIKVFVNGNEMGHVSSESFKVPAKKEFSIPLKAKVSTDSLFSNKNLSGLLGSLLNKNLEVQYIGDIKYKVFGFSHVYKVDRTEKVKIKL